MFPSPRFRSSIPSTTSPRRQTTQNAPAAIPSVLLVPATQGPVPDPSLGISLQFQLLDHSLQLHGYQMYAVEKWLLERNRPITVLVVYTGDPSHRISVFSVTPIPTLPLQQTQAEWDKAINLLRSDGARPKETPHGILMATSLAHFRSDYTIVHIPDGNFLAAREQLYANINLLRMGFSGRSALTLESPSDVTKSRFTSTYHLPESISTSPTSLVSTENFSLPPNLSKTRSHSHSHSTSVLNFGSSVKLPQDTPSSPTNSISKARTSIGIGFPSTLPSDIRGTKENSTFVSSVLELVKLIQAGLAIFGLYGFVSKTNTIHPRLDGLLCDETVDGIRRWIVDIGGPCVALKPTERIVDPTFVAALLSSVLSIRNKLAALGFSQIPKDPFLYPQQFSCALVAYIQSNLPNSSSRSPPSSSASPPPIQQDLLHVNTGMHKPSLHHLFPPHTQPAPIMTPSNSSSSGSCSQTLSVNSMQKYLTRELVEAINSAYDAKVGAVDGRVGTHGGRMRRALRDKLRAGMDSDGDGDRDRGTTSGGEGNTGIGIVGGEWERERGRESVGGVGMGVASSGGQILSGIGSFASGLALGVGAGSGSSPAGAGAILEVTHDLGCLVKSIHWKDGKVKARKAIGSMTKDKRFKDKKHELGDPFVVGYGYGYPGKDKDGNVVGFSVRALWSGQAESILQLREWELEKEKLLGSGVERGRERPGVKERDRHALSDGDVDESVPALAKSETEEESDPVMQGGGFGGMWGEKMQRKLESWKFSKKRGNPSLDMTIPNTRSQADKDAISPVHSKTTLTSSSPALPPIVFVGGDEPDDDDLLSSGQVSPVENIRPTPFSVLHNGRSVDDTSVTTNNNAEYERKINGLTQKWLGGNRTPQYRASSWTDSYDLAGSDMERATARRRETITSTFGKASTVDGNRGVEDEVFDWVDIYAASRRRKEMFGSHRRRSFHDIESLRGMREIKVEHMRIDVQLAGQMLVLSRREEHMRNVMACLQVLTSNLSNTNSQLRENYQTHLPFLSELEAHAQVISTIDAENARADKTSQTAHTLRYEAEQFRTPDMWQTIMPTRRKVLSLRDKVFGMGGRRLPPGVHGAYGKFNRLQWTLDERDRLVDHQGRTESEAEEEKPGAPYLGRQDEEEEEDVVQHPGIKPMWLLRFFTSWGARWGAPSAAATAATASAPSTGPLDRPELGENHSNKKGTPDDAKPSSPPDIVVSSADH